MNLSSFDQLPATLPAHSASPPNGQSCQKGQAEAPDSAAKSSTVKANKAKMAELRKFRQQAAERSSGSLPEEFGCVPPEGAPVQGFPPDSFVEQAPAEEPQGSSTVVAEEKEAERLQEDAEKAAFNLRASMARGNTATKEAVKEAKSFLASAWEWLTTKVRQLARWIKEKVQRVLDFLGRLVASVFS